MKSPSAWRSSEDFCQALGVPSTRKYQATVEGHQNGPSIADISSLLQASDKQPETRLPSLRHRHFVETGREAGLGPTIIREVITSVLEAAGTASDKAIVKMPGDFSVQIHECIKLAIDARLGLLEAALDYL